MKLEKYDIDGKNIRGFVSPTGRKWLFLCDLKRRGFVRCAQQTAWKNLDEQYKNMVPASLLEGERIDKHAYQCVRSDCLTDLATIAKERVGRRRMGKDKRITYSFALKPENEKKLIRLAGMKKIGQRELIERLIEKEWENQEKLALIE